MLTIRALKTQSGSKGGSGVPEYLTATHYYQDKDGQETVASAWFGAGAAALDLKGKPVGVEIMAKLAQGIGPGGERLRRNAGKKPEMVELKDRQGNVRLDDEGKPMLREVAQRIGWDMTFSAPKTVSVAFAAAEGELRDQILAAHHAAVERSLTWIESQAAETRRGKAGKDVHEAGMVISRHTHFAARPHDQHHDGTADMQCDPDLHSHCLAYNLGLDQKGKWGALETAEIYRQKMAVGALYRAELAAGLSRLGFQIEDEIHLDDQGKEQFRAFKVAGIPDELAAEMSGRRAQIETAMRESPELTAQEANLKTRQQKDEPPFEELTKQWRTHLDSFRMRHPELDMVATADELRTRPDELQATERLTPKQQKAQDAELLEKLHASKTVWTRHDLVQQIAERSAGRLDTKGILKECGAFLRRNDLAVIQPERIHDDERSGQLARRHRQVRYADQGVVAQELTMCEAVSSRKQEDKRVEPAKVVKAIDGMEKARGFQLSSEQKKAVAHLTQQRGAVQVLVGYAGTGKTTVSEAVVESHRSDGWGVLGAATGWDAAKKLEAEAGIPSHSIASMLQQLDKGKLKLGSKSLIIVDEAGMVGTPSMAALLGHAQRAGAKVILQGDPFQLQSVERGGAMRALMKETGAVELKSIRRQKHAEDTKTADLFYAVGGEELRTRAQNTAAGREILTRMEKRGQIRAHDDSTEALRHLVADYLSSKAPTSEKLIIAGKRNEVAALNAGVREGLRARGKLGQEHQIAVGFGTEGKTRPMGLAQGDDVRFGAKSKDLGVVNGSKARISGIERLKGGGHVIHAVIQSDIEKEQGRAIAFATRPLTVAEQAQHGRLPAFNALEHGYASTVHKSQGQSKAEVYHYAGDGGVSDRQLALVAFTRQKQAYTLYGTVESIYSAALDANVATDRLQMNALEEGLTGRSTLRPEGVATPQVGKAKMPEPQDALGKVLQRAGELFKQAVDRARGIVSEPAKQRKAQQRPSLQM